MKSIRTMLTVALLLASGSVFADPGCYVGEVQFFSYAFSPVGYLRANGATLEISKYPELYDVMSTMFGGDGVNTFKLPNIPSIPISNQTSDEGSLDAYVV